MSAGRPVIVVGYDGSDTSKRALRWAADQARPDGRLVVVHAYEPPADWFGAPSYQPVLENAEQRGRQLVEEIDHTLLEGVAHDMRLVAKTPPEALIETGRDENADEIVVGSRGYYPVRYGLGSVSNALVQTADRPVVVIPGTGDPPESHGSG